MIANWDSGRYAYDSRIYSYDGLRRVFVKRRILESLYKFTGKERDSESGFDEFGARYYGSNLGRFITPDWTATPIDVPYANFGNPQSLNLYSYVENNPTTIGDPDGHQDGDDPCPCVAAYHQLGNFLSDQWGYFKAGVPITKLPPRKKRLSLDRQAKQKLPSKHLVVRRDREESTRQTFRMER